MSEMRIDSAAEAATSEHPDAGEGPAPDVPPTEGARELQETVRSISRLEESN